jgi:hypothetical protein
MPSRRGSHRQLSAGIIGRLADNQAGVDHELTVTRISSVIQDANHFHRHVRSHRIFGLFHGTQRPLFERFGEMRFVKAADFLGDRLDLVVS